MHEFIVVALPGADHFLADAMEDRFGGKVTFAEAASPSMGYLLRWSFPSVFGKRYMRVCEEVKVQLQDFACGWLLARGFVLKWSEAPLPEFRRAPERTGG